MKKSILLAGIALFAVSCSDEINNQVNNDVLVPVTVHVNGFSVAQEDFPETRTTTAADSYDGINAITLAFYKNGETETYKHEQLKSYATTYTTFGEFECSLPMGSYTMVVLAYHTSDGNPLVLTSPTAAAFTDHSFETFSKVETITINTTTAVSLSTTLDRIIAQLKVVSTDGKTADVSNVRMTFSAGGKDFNPTTGFALTNAGFANTVGNSATVGSTSTSSSFLFLTDDLQNIDVTIETLDADGNTLFSKTIEDVPFKRNKVTKLEGAMYTNAGVTANSFQLNTDWIATGDPIAF